MQTLMRSLAIFGCLVMCGSCTYVKHALIQADYQRLQHLEPSQHNVKHIIKRQNYAFIGRTLDPNGLYENQPPAMAVAAFSSRYKANELVSEMHGIRPGTHFGLDLPEGDYDIVVFADHNQNGLYEMSEGVAKIAMTLSPSTYPSGVVPRQDVRLKKRFEIDWQPNLAVLRDESSQRSLFFPSGTIRRLRDPIFSSEMTILGQYDPAAFLETAPTMFHALEEDVGFKIPVVFVHGLGGGPRDFEALVGQLDRTRFKPWFFYYPSGADLSQMANLFHRIFLSGNVAKIDKHVPIAIVAHSMGGLVVREALNLLSQHRTSYPKIEFISLAAPFGGHPSASITSMSITMVLPSWRNVSPDSRFIRRLFRTPLHSNVTHHLFHTSVNGLDTDGVVPVSSQLRSLARDQATHQHAINASHVGVLSDPKATAAISESLSRVKTQLPDSHMKYYSLGGFGVPVGEIYSEMEAYILRHYGRIIQALSNGEITPTHGWPRNIVPMLRGKIATQLEIPNAWRKFIDSGGEQFMKKNRESE